MPLCTLKIHEKFTGHDFEPFFTALHQIVSKHANIEKCKSWVQPLSATHEGANNQHDIILLELALLPRSQEILNDLGESLLKHLNELIIELVGHEKASSMKSFVEIRIIEHLWL